MVWKRLEREPTKMMRASLMLLVAGLMLGVAGGVGPRLVREAVGSDFERGLMVGVGIGLEIVALVVGAAARSARKSQRPLDLQKVRALLGCRQRAGRQPTPDAVAPAGNEAIGGVTERARDEAQEAGREGPGTGQLGERDGDGGGAGVQRFGWRAGGPDDKDGAGAG